MTTRSFTFLSRKQLAEELDYSVGNIDKLIQRLSTEIGRRYKKEQVKAGTRYNYLVLIDFMQHEDELKDTNLRKYVPKYDAKTVRGYMGL